MKASELRIGNWVKNQHGKEKQVYCINSSYDMTGQGVSAGIKDNYEGLIAYINDEYSPIPLTKQWLKEFGFKNLSNNEHLSEYAPPTIDIEKYYFKVIHDKAKSILFLQHNYSVRWKYVHQLQNLYFALTGEELKLNSEPQNADKR